MALETELRALQRHALRLAVMCALALSALAILHPVPQALVILGGAAILFALAGRTPRRAPIAD
jgi:hypothetical protein